MQSNPEQQHELQLRDAGFERVHDSGRDCVLRLEQIPVIADIGGGIGAQLSSILDAHPSCRGILFDQPSVVAESPRTTAWNEWVATSLREIPVQADAYLMRWIIHDWADDKAVAILEEREKGRTARCTIGAGGVGHPRDGRVRFGQVDGHQYACERRRARAHGLRVPEFV